MLFEDEDITVATTERGGAGVGDAASRAGRLVSEQGLAGGTWAGQSGANRLVCRRRRR